MKTHMFFISFYMLFSCCYAANSTLTQGQSLQDGQTLISPSEDFVLGFFSPGNTSNRYVGIWYNKISVRTVVWVANRETPVSDLSGVLTFVSDGNLLVQDGTGKSLWSTNTSVVVKNATAYLLDSGNFILSIDELRNPEKGLWQSFEDPTDTYLPGMRVGYNPRSKKDLFTSWKSVNDPARGNFSLGIDPKGLLEIDVWRGSEKLWRSGLWDGQIFIGVPSMSSNYLYGSRVSDVGGNSFFSYTARNTSVLLRFHIRWDGKYRLLMWDEGKKEWSTYWGEPANECEPYNTCGVFGRCSVSSSPICSCLTGFVPKSRTEWDKGNWSGGCVRKTDLQCDKNVSSARGGKRDVFLELERMKLPDFYFSIPNINKTQCADICVSNCSCKAYAYVDGIQCLTWDRDFVDIQMFDEGGQKLSVRLAASEIGTRKSKKIIVIVIVVVLGVIILCISAYIFWRRRTKSGHLCKGGKSEAVRTNESTSREIWKDCSAQADMEGNSGGGSELTMHSFKEILNATSNFSSSNKLGEGGFGPVYKGTLPRGLEIAVKRLSRKSGQGLEEFKNEIVLIAKLQHRNLVRLTGYCLEAEEMILVYEYLPKKSLDAYIFSNPQEPLTWVQRFNIIEGIARGLLYLHRDSRLRIIHRDLKAGNILLDEEMTPKISDFGMAKIFGGNENEKNTRRVVGTIGYMAPEYAMEGLFSVKSDVYSFGVLILEIISGKKNQYRHPEYSTNLLGYAWKLWGEERSIEFVDPSIRDSCSECDALRCINVGLLCVQDSALDRPIMSSVVLMLESDTAVLPNPRQPTFTVGRSAMEMELSVDSSQGLTKNSMTDTMVVGR